MKAIVADKLTFTDEETILLYDGIRALRRLEDVDGDSFHAIHTLVRKMESALFVQED